MYGRVTKTRQGRMITINIPLYGFWSNLSVLFPSAFLNPVIGGRLFSTSDLAMTVLARNGDKVVIKNVRLTKLANLKLAANAQVFSADATFTALIANGGDPTDANSFYTLTTGETYAEGDFPQSNFKSLTWTGAWGSRTGFTSILTQEGWAIDWEIKTTPDLVDGIGPVDMFLDLCWCKASCLPVGPSLAQLMATDGAGLNFQGSEAAVGADIANDVDDLVLSDGTSSFTLKAAAMTDSGLVFAPSKKRIRPTVWECTRGFTAGAGDAIAAVA